MTTEEALNECKRIREDIESDIYLEYYNNTEELKNHHLDVIDTVIAALEKQIPKKIDVYYDGYSERYPVWEEHCPECGFDFDGDRTEFCPQCGQAIDWSDEDD